MAPTRQRWSDILLLPPTHSIEPVRQEALRNTYQSLFKTVLRKLASDIRQVSTGAILDIALPVPYLVTNRHKSRGDLYPQIQALVAAIYKIICVVAAKENINVEDRDGIDVRVLLIADDVNISKTSNAQDYQSPIGPVISLSTLACSNRPWRRIFLVESEEGEAILTAFSKSYAGAATIDRIPRSSSVAHTSQQSHSEPLTDPAMSSSNSNSSSSRNHFAVVLGGTFDHIHIGHKLLLAMFAFLLPTHSDDDSTERSLTIGVTGDGLLKEKKYAELLEDWDQRQDSVLQFLRGIMDFRPPADAQVETEKILKPGPNGHANHFWLAKNLVIKCVEINDTYGPTIEVENLSAMVLSAETRAGGKAVNNKRKEKGWAELELFEVDVLDADEQGSGQEQVDNNNFQAKLSSTTIRKGLSEKAAARSKV